MTGQKPLVVPLSAFEHHLYYQTQSGFCVSVDISPGQTVILDLRLGDLRQEIPQLVEAGISANLVFHDPFSPPKAPHLWTVDLFACYAQLLEANQGAVLTYSAAGAVRGGLALAGFTLQRTTGLGAKHGGTKASLTVQRSPNTFPLTPEEQAYLASRSGIPYRDPTFTLLPEVILHNRQVEQNQSHRPAGQPIRPGRHQD